MFRKPLRKFIRPVRRKTYNVNETVEIKLITRLKLSFGHLREHSFRHSFNNTLNSLCACSIEMKLPHLFFRCHCYNENQAILLNDSEVLINPFLSDLNLVNLLVYGNEMFNDRKHYAILMCTINFLKDSQRFAGQLLQSYSFFGSPLPQSLLPSLFLFSIFLKLDYCSF